MARISTRRAVAIGITGALGLTGLAMGQAGPSLPAHPVTTPTPTGFLLQPIADGIPNAALLRHGRDLVVAGDCMGCHLRPGGQPFVGGLPLKTPFGTIVTPNITSDPETGIGAWSNDQFYGAMHEGVGAHGEKLYPAFPYPWFTRATRADDDAVLAYLKSTPAVRYTPPGNSLPFPLNIRWVMTVWNGLFFKPAEFRPDPYQTVDWNRGAYLVETVGHCGACHTPKNLVGADKRRELYRGGELDNWVAPDLTANPRTGLGRWSIDDIDQYLANGRNGRATAGGAMAEVVTYSTALMSDADRRAMAVYLKALPASPDARAAPADPAALRRGAAIYSDACAACHMEGGVGQPGTFAPLAGNAVLQQANPDGLAHLILAGSRMGTSPSHPSPLTMPSFAWKLTDSEVADVATYVRNSWGNHAAPVSEGKVARMRGRVGLKTPRYTVNSGDQR
jgi:mono/diheme cytochrome c family protein